MLIIDRALYIGQGLEKDCYTHPLDASKCIKIYKARVKKRSLKADVSYLNYLKTHLTDWSHVAFYYGVEQTDQGKGYVFQKVVNFDGTKAKKLSTVVETCSSVEEATQILAQLKELKVNIFANDILWTDTCLDNILVSRQENGSYRMMICDGLGKHGLIEPWHFPFALHHLMRVRWQKFCHEPKLLSFLTRFSLQLD